MKTRIGFVSNSSASSYIIAYDPKAFVFCEQCQRGSKDPLTLLQESTYLRPYTDSNDTAIVCADGEERIKQLNEDIAKLQQKIKEAELRPAGEPYDQEWYKGFKQDNPDEEPDFIPKVWEELARCKDQIARMKRQIMIINVKQKHGKKVVWAVVYYNDPVGKVLTDMITKGIVEKVKDL